MSSAVVSTSAALGRPFLFDADAEEVPCHPERSGGCAKRIPRGVEELALSLPKGSLPYFEASHDPRLASITPASHLAIRTAPEMVSSGIPSLNALTGGLPRGCLTELCGLASSGRTSVMLAVLAAATRRGEYCAVIDASDTLDPHSLAVAGVDLDHLLWVRCDENPLRRHRDTEKNKKQKEGCPISRAPFAREACPEFVERVGIFEQAAFHFDRTKPRAFEHRLEQVLRATDLLLEGGGFGLIILDLADVPYQSARRIPLTTWFRFRRAVEHKPTILLAIEQQPIAGSCSSLLLQLGSQTVSGRTLTPPQSRPSREAAACESPAWQCRVGMKKENESHRDVTLPLNPNATADDATAIIISPAHARLLTKLKINVELTRSRLNRKPACSIAFETKTAWAG